MIQLESRSSVPALGAALLAAALAGCSDADVPSKVTGSAGQSATYSAGPFTVESGKELVMCTYVRGTNAEEEDITNFQTNQSEGGHHLIVYTVDHSIDLPPSPCNQGGQPGWSQLVVSQNASEAQSFPDGVGYHIKARQQFVLETHYINTTNEPLTVDSSFSATYAPQGTVRERASSYFFGTYNIDVPPNGSFSVHAECAPPVPMTLHTMAGHEHARGTGVRVDLQAGGAEPERLYETDEWDGPPIRTFEGGLALSKSDTISVDCDWQNDSADRLRYPHEMCFALGYYWPSSGALVCGTGGKTESCLCQVTGDLDAGPGGSSIEIGVRRKEEVEGAVEPVDEGAPLYCALWLADEWAGVGPKDNAPPHYFREAIDVPLATAADRASITFDDVTPGDYAAFCMMDNIGGGFYPGTGDLVSISTPTITAKAGSKTTAEAVLDFVFP